MTMTWDEAAQQIEALQQKQDADRQAARLLITPHVRKPNDRSKLSRHSAASPHNRVAIGAEITGTYCGAAITTEDFYGRDVKGKTAAKLIEWRVCPGCLNALGAAS